MAWCMERTSDDDLSFNLDSELAKASDSVSTPGRKVCCFCQYFHALHLLVRTVGIMYW